MPINQQNNPGSSEENSMRSDTSSNPASSNSNFSTSPSASGYNTAGSGYSSNAGAYSKTSTGSTDSSSTSNNDATMQMVNMIYNTASRWIRENPTLAISAAIGIFATALGFVVANQTFRSRSGNSQGNRYPSGQSYGKPYGSGSVTYNPENQTENINTGADNTSSGSNT